MSDPSAALQEWISDEIKDAGTAAGERVYSRVPRSATLPYVTFGGAQTLPGPGDGECTDTYEAVQTVDIWSDKPGHTQTKSIAAAVRGVLHGFMPVLDGFKVLHPISVSVRYIPESDGLLTHAVVDVSAIIGVTGT